MVYNPFDNSTICAVSTPHGVGGIAVVRVSGPNAIDYVSRLWQGKPLASMQSHTAHYGTLINTAGEPLDDVVLTIFLRPHSFTGEDVVEVSCHGSLWLQQAVVDALIACGCRAALPGEFTRRAFTNGKIDLAQAEAVADVIAATSNSAHRVAQNMLKGALAKRLSAIREKLVHFSSLLELELDFSEEDVEFADRTELLALADEIESTLRSTAQSFRDGDAIKRGLPVAIVGATNAGKSTLLNCLLGEERALVSDTRGTTRDSIEDTITIGGILFRFIDTAGLRHTSDVVEIMGINRTKAAISKARIVLWVIDPTDIQDSLEQVASCIVPIINNDADGSKKVIAVLNKADIAQKDNVDELSNGICALLKPLNDKAFVVQISAKDGTGVDEMKKQIVAMANMPNINDANAVIITNSRHYNALTAAAKAISRAADILKQNMPADLAAQDIRECLYNIGEITGEITNDQILQEIFKSFCIGK